MQPMRDKFTVQNRSSWTPLADVLEAGIEAIRNTGAGTLNMGVLEEPWINSRSLSLTLAARRWRLCLELSGQPYLEESPGNFGLRSLGWVEGGLHYAGPIRLFPKSTRSSTIAWSVVAALQLTESINLSSWFTFGEDQWAKSVMDSNALWHHAMIREILCLPGQNVGLTHESNF